MEPKHQTVLKCTMNHGAIKKSALLQVLRAAIEATEDRNANINEATLDEIITEINRHIKRYDQRLTQMNYALETKDNVYIVFAWTSEAAVNRFQNCYTEGEVKYFHLLIKMIMESDKYLIEPIAALNCTSQITVKPITKSRAEKLLDEWVEVGYFREVDKEIHFGPRMIVEFITHLKMRYPDATKSCQLCQGLTLAIPPWCVKCKECAVEFHGDCIKKYLKRVNGCPKCKKEWNQATD